jgi:small subunit ribosomal protein S6
LAREYELVLMLDPEAPDNRREEIADGARKRIESAGDLKHADSWGVRKMAYEIRRRNEADYRFYRFIAEAPVLDDLDHTLKITDGVLRFRLFKVDPATPVLVPPAAMQPMRAGRDPREARRGGRRGRSGGEESADDAPTAAEAAAKQEAEAAAASPPQQKAPEAAPAQPKAAEAAPPEPPQAAEAAQPEQAEPSES